MFSDPTDHIEYLELATGMYVADIGAGSGHHAILIAKAIGNEGKVYAIDVQKELLSRLKNEALLENLHNIEIIWSDIEKQGSTRLADNLVDRALFSNVLFQLEDKKSAVSEIHRILKPGGKVVIIDWAESFGGMGPHKDMIINPLEAEYLFTSEGFIKEGNLHPGEHHYGLILKKP